MEILPFEKVPRCIGIILDGNRRYAEAEGLSRAKGHHAGYRKFREFLRWAKEAGVRYGIAYAFSTENWKREKGEVDDLMNLFRYAFKNDVEELRAEGVCIHVIGDRSRLPEDLQKLAQYAEERTKTEKTIMGKGFHLVLALSYGGRAEILAAVETFIEMKEGLSLQAPLWLTEENFSQCLWTGQAGIPDPDLIIRPGGEKRLSGFLLWQAAYSELFFSDTLWPDFTKEEFLKILAEYAERKKNYGK